MDEAGKDLWCAEPSGAVRILCKTTCVPNLTDSRWNDTRYGPAARHTVTRDAPECRLFQGFFVHGTGL